MKLTLNITQEHIDNAVERSKSDWYDDTRHNPLGYALGELGFTSFVVGETGLILGHAAFLLPRDAVEYLAAFRAGKTVGPANFVFDNDA